MGSGNTQWAGVRTRAGGFWVLVALLCGALTLGVRAQMGHQHQWQAVDNLSSIGISTASPTGITGQAVALMLPMSVSDTDTCLSQSWEDPCAFYYNEAYNNVRLTAWNDGGAGGRFGYLDMYGQFTATTDPWMISHYECPSAVGTVTLSVTYDDEPIAWEPWTGNSVAT